MMCKLKLLFFLIFIQITKQDCIRQLNQQQLIISRNYQNVITYHSGALISSKIKNYFNNGDNSPCLRDNPYLVMPKPINIGFTGCELGQYISILFMQKYLLNTLKIWFWDFDYLNNQEVRSYNINVYVKIDQVKKKIFESHLAKSIMTIEFPDQFVEEFQVTNLGGNTYNSYLHIIKFEAYYKYS
ncbi:unnamed protein product [Paramecium sonneborni]|uniref:Transmembrane protein n=1 Tax=Paramecium sonneborni TaxID=65129 RepID=A0A8S1RMQ0_9CILI|nr:unnamed protein product [Paramecium sonneborni]